MCSASRQVTAIKSSASLPPHHLLPFLPCLLPSPFHRHISPVPIRRLWDHEHITRESISRSALLEGGGHYQSLRHLILQCLDGPPAPASAFQNFRDVAVRLRCGPHSPAIPPLHPHCVGLRNQISLPNIGNIGKHTATMLTPWYVRSSLWRLC